MTIYFNSLGNNGHLGNQMFQYAALRGIANRKGFDWKVPPKSLFGRNYSLRSSIYECFELPYLDNNHIGINLDSPTITEHNHGYDDWMVTHISDGDNIDGYFQSPKYFNDIQDSIREDFTFKRDIIYSATNPPNDFCAMHVRRTDYIGNSLHHTNLTTEYYEKAMEILNPKNVIVFSDDQAWCRSHKFFGKFIVSGNDEYVDLYLMQNANQHIIANSSFSWWGAWLAQSKNVVAPSNWFGPALSHLNTDDYYLDGWNIV